MKRHIPPEIEASLAAIFASAPLYLTNVVSPLWIAATHLVLIAMAAVQWARKEGFVAPKALLQAIAILYMVIFPIDAFAISRSLISASVHLLLFIAAYQVIESRWEKNATQRMLVIFLLFVTSLATSTDISIVLFVILFTAVMFRQLVLLSRKTTLAEVGLPYSSAAIGSAGLGYVVPTVAIAVLLFPLLPRVRNPLVRGFMGGLDSASTGISDTIDFSQQRTITPDPQVVARVWMPREVVAFFTPLRLRASVYDRFDDGEWRASLTRQRSIDRENEGRWRIARPEGFSRQVSVQQQLSRDRRLFFPVGTTLVSGIGQLRYGPTRGTYSLASLTRESSITYSVAMSRQILPLRDDPLGSTNYPISSEVTALARSIAGPATSRAEIADRIERHLVRTYTYVADPASIGRAMTVDEFLLEEKRGHCEYFAAGMVTLLTALDIPARIVGGFYGGELNPLTGYFVIRRRDAHAWVEMHDGSKWRTFDPTPPDLRPGNVKENLLSLYAKAVGESVNYFWDRYVLTFGLTDQIALLSDTFFSVRDRLQRMRSAGSFSARNLIRRLLIFAVLVALLLALRAVARYQRLSLYERLLELLARSGIDVDPSMTATEVTEKLQVRRPDLISAARAIVDLHHREKFGGADSVSLEHRERARVAFGEIQQLVAGR